MLHFRTMASTNEAPSWADQWGAGGIGDRGDLDKEAKAKENDKKSTGGNAKSLASASFNKAKAAAITGAQKVKCGTSTGFKWVKAKCQKPSSK